MYSYNYVLAAGYAAEGTVVEFISSDATFDNNAKVFVPNADAQTIVVDLITDSVIYNEDSVAADELRIIKANAKNLVDEYVASVIAKASEADKAIIDANMTAVNTAVETAKTAIDDAANEAAVTTIISKAADGSYSGSQVIAIDTAIQTNIVEAVKAARSAAANALQAMYLEFVADGKGELVEDIYNEGVENINAALTSEEVTNAKEAAEEAMDKLNVPAPRPIDQDQLVAWFGPDAATDIGGFKGIATYVNQSLTSVADGTTIRFTGKVTGATVFNADYLDRNTIPGFTADSVPEDATKFIIVPLYFYEDNGRVNTFRFILVSDSATVKSRTDVDPAYVGTYLLTYDWSNIEW